MHNLLRLTQSHRSLRILKKTINFLFIVDIIVLLHFFGDRKEKIIDISYVIKVWYQVRGCSQMMLCAEGGGGGAKK